MRMTPQAKTTHLHSEHTLQERTASRPLSISAVTGLFAAGSALFLSTSLVGVWAAYDRSDAILRFVLLALGVLIVWIVPRLDFGGRDATVGWLGLTAAWIGALVGGLYLAVTAADRLGIGNIGPGSALFDGGLHDNAVAGLLVVLLPLALAGIVSARSLRQTSLLVLAAIAVSFALAALAVSESRGASIGLLYGATAAGYAAWRFRPGRSRRWLITDVLFLSFSAACLAVYVYAIVGGGPGWLPHELQKVSRQVTSASSRLQLWRDSLALIGDYPFTGSGLTGTAMVLSTYVYLLHVPFLNHAHNLYLQIAVEQGIPGVIGFLIMVSASFAALAESWPTMRGLGRVFAALTLASLVAMLVHGLFDSELYVSVFVPVVFLPLGIAFLIHRRRSDQPLGLEWPAYRIRPLPAAMAALLVVGLTAAVLFGPWGLRLKSAAYANLGAVEQTRAELGVYEWPLYPSQDSVRRAGGADLALAMDLLAKALQSNPSNRTANFRLGQLALANNNRDAAGEYLSIAHAHARLARAVPFLLGEIAASKGDTVEAVRLWQEARADERQLASRQLWYDYIGEGDTALLIEEIGQIIAQRDGTN